MFLLWGFLYANFLCSNGNIIWWLSLSILTYFPFLIGALTYIFLLQTKTNSISWNPMEPMNFTAVSMIIELIQFSFFFFLVLFLLFLYGPDVLGLCALSS